MAPLPELAGFPGAARQVMRALQKSHGLPWQWVVAAEGRVALPREHGVDGGEVRYVVVPFNDNADRQANAASEAIIETAFDRGQ